MKAFLAFVFTGVLFGKVNGQVSFSPVDSKLSTVKNGSLTQLTCSGSSMSVKFLLNRSVSSTEQTNFITVDNQTIQVTPLRVSGYKTGSSSLSLDDQKELLKTYSDYELDYLGNELKVEIINPNYQFVIIKSRGWFIWYFRVGSVPVDVYKKIDIQLFASTVIGDKILTINAPVVSDGDFKQAGVIVNEMMENLTVSSK